MHSTSWEIPSWMKLKSRLQGEISITSDMQMTPPLWQKEKKKKKLTSLLMKVKEESEKSCLKVQHSES